MYQKMGVTTDELIAELEDCVESLTNYRALRYITGDIVGAADINEHIERINELLNRHKSDKTVRIFG